MTRDKLTRISFAGFVLLLVAVLAATDCGASEFGLHTNEPELGSVDIDKLASDPEERATLGPRIEEYVLWHFKGSWEPILYFGFRFGETPVAGRSVHLSISVGPSFAPTGRSVAWVEVPPGFKVLGGAAVGTTDVGPVTAKGILEDAGTTDEGWRRVEELTRQATVRIELDVRAEEGVHQFRVYGAGRTATGRPYADFEDYWVRVTPDTAEISEDEHFRKYPRPGTDTGHTKPGKPPYAREREGKLDEPVLPPATETEVPAEPRPPVELKESHPMEERLEIDYTEIEYRDGEVWIRRAGESEFKRPEQIERASEENGCSPAEHRHYVVQIDIKDERVRALLKGKFGLEVRGSLPQQTRLELEKREIEILKMHSVPMSIEGEHEQYDGFEPTYEKEGCGDREPARQSQTIIFREDFESNSVPGTVWDAGDLDPNSGEDYWGDQWVEDGARVRGGSWSCYCADYGDVFGQQYDDDMNSYFSNVSPIYLAPYDTVFFYFSTWYHSEPGYDSLLWYYSPNGSSWYLGEGWSGDSGGWRTKIYKLYGFGDFYMKFVFRSDAVIHSYEGAYIDDIVLSSSRLPNLLPYAPAGWDYPIVPSSVTGTHTVNDLYEDIGTYIDWAVANNGWGDVDETFYVYLYLDDDRIGQWYATSLPSGYYAPLEDWAYTVADSGLHTLRLVTDPDDYIVEVDEGDNAYERVFHWRPAWITVTGYFEYHDENAGIDEPIQYAKVSVYDADTAGGDDLLDSSSTDGYGFYSVGPVWNIDDESGTQDVYVRAYGEAAVSWPDRPTSAVKVVHLADSVWAFDTSVSQDVYGGDFYIGTSTCPERHNGAYNLYQVILEGYNWVRGLSNQPVPPQLSVKWYPGYQDSGTGYVAGRRRVYVRGDSSATEYTPDQWDDEVVLHEYGHFIADVSNFLWPYGAFHHWEGKYDPGISWNEGWAHYFACAVRNQQSYRNVRFDGHWVDYNLETGVKSFSDGTPSRFANALGESCEASVGGAVWDIFDDADDDQDNDGIGDELSDGMDNIWDVVYFYEISQHGPHNVDEFWDGWFARQHDSYTEMHRIWCEHAMESQAGIDDVMEDEDYVLAFKGAHPNPFHNSTAIRFSLSRTQEARVSVYDTMGRFVR